MRVLLNDEPIETDENISVGDLLVALKFPAQAIAVAIDGEFVPRHTWATVHVKQGQKIEVVSPMQGG